jgi:pSer/pThr/pTyr-binding forkhead associated (FHA) protein
MSLFIEVLARNGEVLTRHRASGLPIRIGRAYDNHLILDDPYVAAHHVVIEAPADAEADASPIARDLGSKNGLYRGGRGKRGRPQREAAIALQADTVIRIGHTLLRIRRADQAVGPELVDTTSHYWEGGPPAVAAMLAVVLVGAFNIWATDTEGKEPLEYLSTLLALVAAGVTWATVWALLNRIFGGRLRFGRHLFIGASGFVVALLWQELAELVAYSFSVETLSRFDSLFAPVIFAVILRYHLATIRPHALRFARAAAVSVAVVLIGVALVQNQISQRRLADELYMTGLKPPVWRIVGERSSADFFEAAKAAKPRVDTARRDMPGQVED